MKKKLLLIKHPVLLLFLMGTALLLSTCKKDIKSETVVYSNDFESGDLQNFTNGAITAFNGSNVLGRYNSNGFGLALSNLPKHNLVVVSFDLYIHDTWDGNELDNGYSGPDLWRLVLDGNTYINASFSNADCANAFCTPQSYPNDYLNSNHNPKTGAYRTDLPGACYWASKPNGTTQYKISKTIDHTNSTLLLQGIGDLVQKGNADPTCDESWSIDNLQIKVIAL